MYGEFEVGILTKNADRVWEFSNRILVNRSCGNLHVNALAVDFEPLKIADSFVCSLIVWLLFENYRQCFFDWFQGLLYAENDTLFESTGLYGRVRSSLFLKLLILLSTFSSWFFARPSFFNSFTLMIIVFSSESSTWDWKGTDPKFASSHFFSLRHANWIQ